MTRQDVINALKQAGISEHQAEQVGYLYTQFGALQRTAKGYEIKSLDYFNAGTVRKAAANPMFPRNLTW